MEYNVQQEIYGKGVKLLYGRVHFAIRNTIFRQRTPHLSENIE